MLLRCWEDFAHRLYVIVDPFISQLELWPPWWEIFVRAAGGSFSLQTPPFTCFQMTLLMHFFWVSVRRALAVQQQPPLSSLPAAEVVLFAVLKDRPNTEWVQNLFAAEAVLPKCCRSLVRKLRAGDLGAFYS